MMDKYEIVKDNFRDDYKRLLAIIDHLQECSILYYEHKLKHIEICEFKKELIDLYILLKLEVDINELNNLYELRLQRFIQKATGIS